MHINYRKKKKNIYYFNVNTQFYTMYHKQVRNQFVGSVL